MDAPPLGDSMAPKFPGHIPLERSDILLHYTRSLLQTIYFATVAREKTTLGGERLSFWLAGAMEYIGMRSGPTGISAVGEVSFGYD